MMYFCHFILLAKSLRRILNFDADIKLIFTFAFSEGKSGLMLKTQFFGSITSFLHLIIVKMCFFKGLVTLRKNVFKTFQI